MIPSWRPPPPPPDRPRPAGTRPVLADIQDVYLGDVRGGRRRGEDSPAWRVPGGAVVDVVSWWWSVCRVGGFLGDGGAGGLLVGDGLVLGAGGEERGDGEAVDGAGDAAGVRVDDADGIIGEQGVGAAGVGEVRPDVAVGLGGGDRRDREGVLELHPLVEGGHVADVQAAAQGGLADEQDGERGAGVERVAGHHPDAFELVAGEQVGFVDGEDDVAVALVGLGGERGRDLGDEVAWWKRGACRGPGDGGVDAADPDLGVGQVDEGVAGGVEAVGGGAERGGLAGADLAGDDAEAAGGDEPAQPGDGFLVGGGGEQRGDGDGR